jgi:hypothetical protein
MLPLVAIGPSAPLYRRAAEKERERGVVVATGTALPFWPSRDHHGGWDARRRFRCTRCWLVGCGLLLVAVFIPVLVWWVSEEVLVLAHPPPPSAPSAPPG